MEESVKKDDETKIPELKTTPIPFSLNEIRKISNIVSDRSTKPSKDQLIKQGFKLHSEGNEIEALRFYENFINLGYEDYRVFLNYGSLLLGLGKLEKAEKWTRRVLDLKPDLPQANFNLGNILNDLGKLKAAEKYIRKAIKFKPDFVNAHLSLATILKDLGNLKEAETFSRKAISLKPNNLDACFNLGNILKNLGNLEEAEIYTRKAIRLKPDFEQAYLNLALIRKAFGDLREAEKYNLKAMELNPKNKTLQNNFIHLLTVYNPQDISSSPLCLINEQFLGINLFIKKNDQISDDKAIKIYRDGLEIYKKYDLDIVTSLLQIYKKNDINLNCKRHKLIFNQYKIIPEFCFACYKVQIELDSIIELIKLFLVFNKLNLKNCNTRKCMIELRSEVKGFYKGLIYCTSLDEAVEISKKLNDEVEKSIRFNLKSKVKRGCSEYQIEFPKYKDIRMSGDQLMIYNESWRSIEKEIDKGTNDWGKSNRSVEGFNLNNFLIMRNWIAYAQQIGDQTVNKITNEKIKGPKVLHTINRRIN